MYRLMFLLLLTRIDPETAHHFAVRIIRALQVFNIGRLVELFTRPDKELRVKTLGLEFSSPFGIAAGFDKDARAVLGLGFLGFGHVEVGTITAIAQPGNPRPRLFRLVSDQALINRMGFNNLGADAAAGHLARIKRRSNRPVVGVNIGKSRVVAVADAVADYQRSAALLARYADYLVVNVSSPNTPGLRDLQEIDSLAKILTAVRAVSGKAPLLVKIAPDISDDGIRQICDLANELGIDGIVATNTTVRRGGLRSAANEIKSAGSGGLSGAPLAKRSIEVLKVIRGRVPQDFCIISVGGVQTPADVQDRLDAGATLVQGYSGFIYHGPLWARNINRGLARFQSSRARRE